MEEFKLGNDVFDQIKDFDHEYLTEEQELLIEKLILNEEFKKCYKKNGLCKKCKQLNTDNYWCQSCTSKNFTSGNHDIDEFIQKAQLKANSQTAANNRANAGCELEDNVDINTLSILASSSPFSANDHIYFNCFSSTGALQTQYLIEEDQGLNCNINPSIVPEGNFYD